MMGNQNSLCQQANTQKTNESGQSTIEFLCTFAFVLATIIMFIKISLNSTNGYLVHYATYMASRAYLVNDKASASPSGGDGKAASVAKSTFKKIVPTLPGNGSVKVVNGSKAIFRGFVATFKQKFSFSNIIRGRSDMTFISESFLGREPTQAECAKQVCRALNLSIGAASESCPDHSTAYDNGC